MQYYKANKLFNLKYILKKKNKAKVPTTKIKLKIIQEVIPVNQSVSFK